MLNRRHLRIKVLQELYAFYQSGNDDLAAAEKNLFRNLDKIYELYLFMLLFFSELCEFEKSFVEERAQKKYYGKQNEKPADVFSRLRFCGLLTNDRKFASEVKRLKLSWQAEHHWMQNIYARLLKTPEFEKAVVAKTDEFVFLSWFLERMIASQEDFRTMIEEKNIHWDEEFDFVCHMLEKTIKDSLQAGTLKLMRLFRDEKDDKDFVKDLFLKTILHSEEYQAMIAARTQHWEVDRIALMDNLLMKMALAEISHFPTIPVKVSINEYIDISKDYSTPKSREFINGIIDKLAIGLRNEGKIVKTGRGLIEQ
jgi:N utilization substance protein B